MTGILSSISNLLSSIFDIFRGLFNTLLSSVQGVLSVFTTTLGSVTDLFQGIVNLLLGNIVLIGVAVAAVVGWSAYQQRRGNVQQGSAIRAKKNS
jgi:hypothetical protein